MRLRTVEAASAVLNVAERRAQNRGKGAELDAALARGLQMGITPLTVYKQAEMADWAWRSKRCLKLAGFFDR